MMITIINLMMIIIIPRGNGRDSWAILSGILLDWVRPDIHSILLLTFRLKTDKKKKGPTQQGAGRGQAPQPDQSDWRWHLSWFVSAWWDNDDGCQDANRIMKMTIMRMMRMMMMMIVMMVMIPSSLLAVKHIIHHILHGLLPKSNKFSWYKCFQYASQRL